MKDEEYRYWRIPRNRKEWPNATFGTIRYFFLTGIFIGLVLGFFIGNWIAR